MENTERFEQLLRHRPYQELTGEEKVWVQQFVMSEEEYESLRHAMLQLDGYFASPTPALDPSVLRSLKMKGSQIQRTDRSGIRSVWSLPAWAATLVLVITGTLGVWIGSQSVPGTVYVDRTLTRVDTLRLSSHPDTVIVERVIYLPVKNNSSSITVMSQPDPPLPGKGINMKEKEEMEKLMVSGR